LSVLFPTLSGSTAMPGIELPVPVPDMFAREARCAQAMMEIKSKSCKNSRNGDATRNKRGPRFGVE
jgi:hypothetical protein